MGITSIMRKNMRATFRVITALQLMTISSLASAEFYVGGSAGISQKQYVNVQDGTAYKVSGGYKFRNNIAVDVAYLNSGAMDIDTNNTSLQGRNVYLQFQGMSYSAVYYLRMPNSQRWSMTGKIGIYHVNSKLKSRDTGQELTDTSTGVGWGIGADYAVLKHLSLGFDLEGYAGVEDFADNKVLTLIVGSAGYHF